jgi:exodeoxyribonuclease X
MDAIIFDTETTGRVEPQVIELAWLGWHPDDGSYYQRFKPTKPVEWGALATHHILMEDLEDQPPTATAALPAGIRYVIGHNVDFDWAVMGKPDVKRICTLAMARAVWPNLDSHSLVACLYFTEGATDSTRQLVKGAHNALDDVMMTKRLLDTIMGLMKITSLERLWEFSEDSRVPRVMPLGKFKGQPVSAVDRGYVNWYRRQPDPDPYLVEAFRREGLC